MDSTPASVFLASLKRCLAVRGFLRGFYDLFLASSPEVAEKFKNTDFDRQVGVLEDSLFAMANFAQGQDGSPARALLPRIAEDHSKRVLDIRPGLYDDWLECLLRAARGADPQFSPEIETAWKDTLLPGIEYMRSRY